ncbi:MAG: HEPN domain-containing protein [Microcoleaceae cyanobacterium]
MDNFEQNGIWFLPETTEIQITGTLSFSPEKKPQLNLVGELKKNQNITEKFENPLTYPIINGWLISAPGKSEAVTLCNCSQRKEIKTGIQTSEIYPDLIIKGYHFSGLEDIKFTALIVRYTQLEKWVNLPNVEITATPSSSNPNCYKEINVRQTIKEPIEIGKLNEFSISILDKAWFTPQMFQFANFFGADTSKLKLEERKKILFKADVPKSIDEFREVIYLFQEFLTFACGQIVLPDTIESLVLGKSIEYDFPMQIFMEMENSENLISSGQQLTQKEVEKRFPIKIFYQNISPQIYRYSFEENQILFRFTDIQDNSQMILESWKYISETLGSILEIYMRVYYTPIRHTKDLFLSLAQAIEGFHRIHHNGKYCDDSVFDNIREELKKVFSAELKKHKVKEEERDSILNKIQYWNEFSLKERLENLFEDEKICSCLPDRLFENSDAKHNFVRQVRDTRGSLTHPTTSKTNKTKSKYIVTGVDLVFLTRKLRIILEVCLLQTLGILPSKIKSIMEQRD